MKPWASKALTQLLAYLGQAEYRAQDLWSRSTAGQITKRVAPPAVQLQNLFQAQRDSVYRNAVESGGTIEAKQIEKLELLKKALSLGDQAGSWRAWAKYVVIFVIAILSIYVIFAGIHRVSTNIL
jgi:hypothetical protein